MNHNFLWLAIYFYLRPFGHQIYSLQRVKEHDSRKLVNKNIWTESENVVIHCYNDGRAFCTFTHTAISIKVVLVQAKRKSRIRARKGLGITNKLMNFQSDRPVAFRARIRLFCFARGQP